QNFNALVDMAHRVDCELALAHSLHHVLAQHQVLHVCFRDQNALVAGESTCLADVEEAFDLFIDPSNRLHLAFLVHGSSDRKTLLDGHLGEGRQQRIELRRGGAVSVDPAIGLLENQGSRQGQWYILGIPPGKVAPEDHDALRVQRPAELHLALDVDDAALAHPHPDGDAARPAEGERPDLNDGKAVDLANLGTVGVDEDDVALDDLLRPVADSTGALDAFLDGPLDVLA